MDARKEPLPEEIIEPLIAVGNWMSRPEVHLYNNVHQWASVYENQDHDPRPEQIVSLPPTWQPGWHPGLEPPSAFWPKFEHRFAPAERLWASEVLPIARRSGDAVEEVVALFNAVLTARDALVFALPADRRTPEKREVGARHRPADARAWMRWLRTRPTWSGCTPSPSIDHVDGAKGGRP